MPKTLANFESQEKLDEIFGNASQFEFIFHSNLNQEKKQFEKSQHISIQHTVNIKPYKMLGKVRLIDTFSS